jgi:hypothetical protein
MDRRSFFRFLAVAPLAVPMAAKAAAMEPIPVVLPRKWHEGTRYRFAAGGLRFVIPMGSKDHRSRLFRPRTRAALLAASPAR